ncbi:MAG: zinc ribbon domain-containing protein [Clostridia bacterium]|nr:zinc ribbon domain-containing protein [Clostridia bacterium]
MKSIKPGRGPSFMGGIGSVAAVIFGVIWTFTAATMGAPALFPLFGVVFIILGIVQAVYNFKNAAGKNRFSTFDITDEGEETDPLNDRFGQPDQEGYTAGPEEPGNFCPYCGAGINFDYAFCRKCGRKL